MTSWQLLDNGLVIHFRVIRVQYYNSKTGYTVAKVKLLKYPKKNPPKKFFEVVGYFYSVFDGDEFKGEGVWTNHPIYGKQFYLIQQERIMPVTLKGIREFLVRFGKEAKIGKKTAEKIVNIFKENTLSTIRDDWRNLLQVKGITEKKAKAIHAALNSIDKYEEAASFLLQHGISYKDCLRIFDRFKEYTVKKIKENPYLLLMLPDIEFKVADTFAKNLNLPFDNIERLKEGILFFIAIDMKNKGNLFIFKETILDELDSFLKKEGAYGEAYTLTPKAILDALNELTKEHLVIEEDSHGRECVYLRAYYHIENQIVELVREHLLLPKPPLVTSQQINQFINHHEENGMKFAKEQKQAIYMALENGFSILTGGPGTGKTHTINAIIQCLQTFKPEVKIDLCAPTGKAAKRITELTYKEAKTIHRLIGLGFDKDQEIEIINSDFLIVDESSMVDAYVFSKLLEAVQPKTRILLVGDAEQLPSVGPGLILRDLIDSEVIPVTRLKEIFRQAKHSQIITNAHAVINNKPQELTFDTTKKDFYFIERDDVQHLRNTILASIYKFVKNQGYKFDDIQVLSPINDGDLGVHELNRLIQMYFNPESPTKKEVPIDEISVFREGDKVMQTVNNYDLDVYNGEVGTITRIYDDTDGPKLEVDFGDKVITYDEENQGQLTHAFVISIHKSQGSEFPVVIIPIHQLLAKQLNRNLVYTAITRARKCVVLIGQKDVLYRGINKADNIIRNSQVKDKLKLKLALPRAS